jgi:hypothetical protein
MQLWVQGDRGGRNQLRCLVLSASRRFPGRPPDTPVREVVLAGFEFKRREHLLLLRDRQALRGRLGGCRADRLRRPERTRAAATAAEAAAAPKARRGREPCERTGPAGAAAACAAAAVGARAVAPPPEAARRAAVAAAAREPAGRARQRAPVAARGLALRQLHHEARVQLALEAVLGRPYVLLNICHRHDAAPQPRAARARATAGGARVDGRAERRVGGRDRRQRAPAAAAAAALPLVLRRAVRARRRGHVGREPRRDRRRLRRERLARGVLGQPDLEQLLACRRHDAARSSGEPRRVDGRAVAAARRRDGVLQQLVAERAQQRLVAGRAAEALLQPRAARALQRRRDRGAWRRGGRSEREAQVAGAQARPRQSNRVQTAISHQTHPTAGCRGARSAGPASGPGRRAPRRRRLRAAAAARRC